MADVFDQVAEPQQQAQAPSGDVFDQVEGKPIQANVVRGLNYGAIVGEHTRDTTQGPLGRLDWTDVALSPNLLREHGGPYSVGQNVDVADPSGRVLGQYRVADYSYYHPGQPTKNTIELRDRLVDGPLLVTPSPDPKSLGAQAMQEAAGRPAAADETPQQTAPPTLLDRIHSALNFISQGKSGTQMDQAEVRQHPEALTSPLLQFPRITTGPDASLRERIEAALGNTGRGFISGATSPLGALALADPVVGGATLLSQAPALAQQVQAAERTPAGSQERLEAGLNTVLNLGTLAAGAKGVLRDAPTLPESGASLPRTIEAELAPRDSPEPASNPSETASTSQPQPTIPTEAPRPQGPRFLDDPSIAFLTKDSVQSALRGRGYSDADIARLTTPEVQDIFKIPRARETTASNAASQPEQTLDRPIEPANPVEPPSDEDIARRQYEQEQLSEYQAANQKQGQPLLQWLQDQGGLPTPRAGERQTSGYHGELAGLQEEARGGAGQKGVVGLFRNDAQPIDQLVQQAKADGYNIETPDDLIEATRTELRRNLRRSQEGNGAGTSEVPEAASTAKTTQDAGKIPAATDVSPIDSQESASASAAEEPPAQPQETIPTEPERTTGIANRIVKAEGESGRLAEKIMSGQGRSAKEMIARGRRLINEFGHDPQQVARRFKRNERISPDDFSVVRAQREILFEETNRLEKEMNADPNNPSKRVQWIKARRLETQWVRDVVQPIKTKISDEFRNMQEDAPVDHSTFAGLRKAFIEQNGREPRPNEELTLKSRAQKVRSVMAAEDAATRKLSGEIDRTLPRTRVPTSEELRADMMKMARELTPC